MRATGRFEMDFDVVTAVLTAKPGLACDWYDAADLYRDWAKTTRFRTPDYVSNAFGVKVDL